MKTLTFVLLMWITFARATTTGQPTVSTTVPNLSTMTKEVTFAVSTTPKTTTTKLLTNVTHAITEGNTTAEVTTDDGVVNTTHKLTTDAQTTTSKLVTSTSTGSLTTATTGSLTSVSTGSLTSVSTGSLTTATTGSLTSVSTGSLTTATTGSLTSVSTGSLTSASTGSLTTATTGSLTSVSTGSLTSASTGSLTSASTGSTTTVLTGSVTATSPITLTPHITKSKHDPCGQNPCRNDSASFCSVTSTTFQCLCLPGYYRNTTNSKCQRVLQFGGSLVVASSSSRRRRRAVISSVDVHTILDDAFSDEVSGYLDVTVDDEPEMVDGVESWGYVVICDYESSADGSEVTTAMDKYLTDKCGNASSCDIPVGEGSISVATEETKAAAGTVDEAVCEKQPCQTSSTTCDVLSGVPVCQCKKDFRNVYGSLVSCTGIICSDDSQCNQGTCDPSANMNLGECKCTTLYKGEKCDNPWFLVFVIVISLLGFIFLVTVTFVITRRLRSKRKGTKKIVMTNLYDPKPLDVPDLSLRARAPSGVMFSNESFAP